MIAWFRHLDLLLRGESTRLPLLRSGGLRVPAGGLSFVAALLGALYGVCMGVFALTAGGSRQHMQMVASTLKVPALFLLTLLVTFPSLYVFSALMGSRLTVNATLRVLVAALAVMLAVLSSLGPIVAFFSFTTTSYPFMVLLNVVVFAVSGMLGLAFLLQTLRRLAVVAAIDEQPESTSEAPPPVDEAGLPPIPPPVPYPPGAGPLDRSGRYPPTPQVSVVFRIWIVVFGLVGAQMSWILRPFIGHPNLPFQWFRSPGSNFFEGVMHAIKRLAE
jgi:hypothetical protein